MCKSILIKSGFNSFTTFPSLHIFIQRPESFNAGAFESKFLIKSFKYSLLQRLLADRASFKTCSFSITLNSVRDLVLFFLFLIERDKVADSVSSYGILFLKLDKFIMLRPISKEFAALAAFYSLSLQRRFLPMPGFFVLKFFFSVFFEPFVYFFNQKRIKENFKD